MKKGDSMGAFNLEIRRQVTLATRRGAAGAGVWLLAAVAGSGSTLAIAQDQGATLEEVLVTAQKREESLQDVPISVSALSSEDLANRGVTALGNLQQAPVPGLFIQPFAGVSSVLIIDMRGVTTSDPSQGTAEMGTAVYLDDVYLGRAQGLGTEIADPERIEVLRGPQGTLFGRNAQGGAVRIVSKKPTGEFGGTAKVAYGDYGHERYEAHLNLPEFAGLALKLDYLSSHLDGYTENGPRLSRLSKQRDFGYRDGDGYRASLRWQPTDAITLDYAYEHSDTDTVGDYFVLVRPSDASPQFILPPTFSGARPTNESIHRRTEDSWIALFNEPFNDRVDGHTLQAEFELTSSLKLRSISAYRELDNSGSQSLGGAFAFVPLGPAGVPVAAFTPRPDTSGVGLPSETRVYAVSGTVPYSSIDQDQRSQEFQLIGSTEQLEYVVGAYYYKENVQDTRQTFFNIMYTDPAFTNALGVNPFSLPFPGQGVSLQEAHAESSAGFAQVTWTPASVEQWHFTTGIRYTDDRKEFRRTRQGGAVVNIVPELFEERRWDPAATIAFDFTTNINAYLRYAQAYRAGGVNTRSPTFRPFASEENKSLELGVKSQLLDNRLRLNIAAFENRITDRQMTIQVNPNNPAITDTLNAPGETRIRGVEIEGAAALTDELTMSITYAYQDGELDAAALARLDPGSIFQLQSLPKHAGTVSVDYTLPPFSFGELGLHANYAIASDTPGTVRVPRTGYAYEVERNVANARVTLRNMPVGPVDLAVSGFINNVFDEAYPVFTAPGANAALMAPRTAGVEFTMSF
jgi:iron complex outermembrane receptor protein